MILSNILFPTTDICQEAEMYFRSKNTIVKNNEIYFFKNSFISTSTYFNSFSIRKWLKYTIIDNLKLKLELQGSFSVSLFSMKYENDTTEKKELLKTYCCFDVRQSLVLNFDNLVDEIAYFELTALTEDSVFFGGHYYTKIDSKQVSKVSLAVGICTFQREEFIKANLKRLSGKILDENSVLFNNIDIFVADNGQTLPIEELENEHIYIFKNKNLGGAGGFGRCMIEANYRKETKQYTNFIFMDDDIVLDINAMEKNYIFLSLIKKEYKEYVIGGAMFSTDNRYLQFENGALWKDENFIFNRRNSDMRYEENLLLNEQDCEINYNAWCYCCVPMKFIKNSNLPIPIFFHMDDVEFSLRNNVNVLTLNGINVWHLYKKSLVNAKNDYYDVRNKLIMLSEIEPHRVYGMVHNYISSFVMEVLKYHYARAYNAFEGIMDFCKGFDYFKDLDTIKKHKSLFNNVKWDAASKDRKEKAQYSVKDKRGRKIKIKNAIYQFLPSKINEKVVFDDNGVEDVKGCKKIVVYNSADNVSIIYKKNRMLAIKCLLKRFNIKKLIKNKLPEVIEEFHNRISEVQNINFWDSYLGINKSPRKKYKILFAASDNDATSGAFRSMVFLNKLLNEKYDIETIVLLPSQGDGTNLLKEHNINYTIFKTLDWIIKVDEDKNVINEKIEKINHINSIAEENLCKFIQKEKIDLIHINTSYHYVVALVAKQLNIPLVWHLREFLEEDQKRKIIDSAQGYKLINEATKIVAISNSLYEKYENIFDKQKLVTIYNGIDVEKFYDAKKIIFKNKKLIFICVGVIAIYKGQHYLLEACGKLINGGFSNFEVWLVGNNIDEYMSMVNEVINLYGLSNHVKFWGKRNDVDQLFRKADIAFVCSTSEAFGRVTIEAMMSGCLVIGANTAGTKELIIDEKDGLLFEANNSDDLHSKIDYAIKNISLMKKFADAGRDKAINQYSAEKNAENIYSLYKKTLEKDCL